MLAEQHKSVVAEADLTVSLEFMKTLLLAILAAVALMTSAHPAVAEIDPRCANIDVYSDAVQTSTGEMQAYLQMNDTSSAKLMYENGVNMALTAYKLVAACNGYNPAEIDWGFERLVETAYDGKVIDAREACAWIHAILVNAYKHGDTRDQIERWTALEEQLALKAGVRFQESPHQLHSPRP